MDERSRISGRTRVVAILGDPVEHSLSPTLHNAAFAACDLDWVYVAARVPAERLPGALDAVRALGLAGCNLTVPHKEAAIACLDELRDDALRTGAVNTVVNDGGRLVGHNTDVEGFRRALRRLVPEGVEGRPALVLGAGGAARAVVLALAREGVGSLTIAGRTRARVDAVAAMAAEFEDAPGIEVADLAGLTAAEVRAADVLVNATSLGMAGGGQVPAILVDNVGVDQIVYDVVYGRRPTGLVRAALDRGARAADGKGMLVEQAATAFELWTGHEAPRDVMIDAVRH